MSEITQGLNKALQGVRILDFSYIVAGPFCTKCLGDYGAEVIWVENPFAMEIRSHNPFAGGKPGINRSGLYLILSSSKLGMVLNLKHPRGVEVARRLAATADLVLDQFTPGTMERLGLGYDELKKIKPDTILLQMSAQGQTGPFARQPGFGNISQSMLGFTHLTGYPDREPYSLVHAPYIDYVTGFAGILLLVSALLYRRRTGKGQRIDLSMAEASLQCVSPMLLDYTANHREMQRNGNSLDRAAPHGVFRCVGEDRWCALGVFTDQQWQDFCRIIGKPELTMDPRFSTFLARKRNEPELNRVVEDWTRDRLPQSIVDPLREVGIPAALWYNERDISECPSLRERGFFQTQSHPEAGNWSCPSPPFKLLKTPSTSSTPPLVGQDTYRICTELLGMTDLEFADLEETGIFRVQSTRSDQS